MRPLLNFAKVDPAKRSRSAASLRQYDATAASQVKAAAGRDKRLPRMLGTEAAGYIVTMGKIVNQKKPIDVAVAAVTVTGQ